MNREVELGSEQGGREAVVRPYLSCTPARPLVTVWYRMEQAAILDLLALSFAIDNSQRENRLHISGTSATTPSRQP